MTFTTKVALLALKIAVLTTALVYASKVLLSNRLPTRALDNIRAISVTLSTFLLVVDAVFIYPFFRNPLRKLPTPKERNRMGVVMESPRGKTPLDWIKTFPDAELVHIRGIANSSLLMPVSASALRDVLSTHTYDFEKPWGVRAFLARVIGFGLILSEGDAHRKQRKALTPAFHIRKIRELYGLMWDKTQVLLEQLEKDIDEHPVTAQSGEKVGKVEMAEWASRLTLDVIGPTAMGRDFQSLTTVENPIAQAFLEILEPNRQRLAYLAMSLLLPQNLIRHIPWSVNEVLDRNEKFLRGLCHEIVAEKKKDLHSEKAAHDYDILTQIVKTNSFTDDSLVDQMLTFLAAGHETTASALTWCTYLLHHNPHVQSTLRAEIRANIPSASAPITHDLLESLPYLNGVCEEILRLFPTVPLTVRESTRPTTIANNAVPAGVPVLLCPYAINRNPQMWGPNAGEMQPERWIDTLEDGSTRPNKNGGVNSNFAEITFLHGPRACIGRDFAKAELRCAIAGLVGRFHVELERPDEDIKIEGVVTTKPRNGMHLLMKPIPGW